MNINPFRFFAIAAAITFGIGASAQNSPKSNELCIGQHAPSFTLKDQNDKEVSLDALLKNGPVAVVFIRSADWCVYCQLQLMQLQMSLKKIEASGGRVVAVSYDAPEKLKNFANRHKINFPLLSDANGKVIEAYKMRSPVGTGNQVGCSRHGTFILDQNGIVRSKPYLVSYESGPLVDALSTAFKEALEVQNGGKKL